MQIVEKQISSGETVTMDDKHFLNCKFTNCKLIYGGGDFQLTETAIDNCQFVLSGPAQKTAAFLMNFGILKPPPGFQGIQVQATPPKSSLN
jgi:hypothetical protein